MTKTQRALLARAMTNGGKVRIENNREKKAFQTLLDIRAIERTADDCTLTDHGRAIVEYLTKNDLMETTA